jgi:hypothetical protein
VCVNIADYEKPVNGFFRLFSTELLLNIGWHHGLFWDNCKGFFSTFLHIFFACSFLYKLLRNSNLQQHRASLRSENTGFEPISTSFFSQKLLKTAIFPKKLVNTWSVVAWKDFPGSSLFSVE